MGSSMACGRPTTLFGRSAQGIHGHEHCVLGIRAWRRRTARKHDERMPKADAGGEGANRGAAAGPVGDADGGSWGTRALRGGSRNACARIFRPGSESPVCILYTGDE